MALKYQVLLITLLLIISLQGGANDTLSFRQLTFQDGLSQGVFRDILQDDKGFIWLATFAGLNRFDGNEVVVYEADGETGSLENHEIFSLYQDGQHQLWVGTHNHLYALNRESQTFRKIQTAWSSQSDLIIYDIFEDRSRMLWVGTNQGIASFDRTTQKLVKSHFFTSRSNATSEVSCYAIEECENGDLWFATNRGVLHLDKDTETTKVELEGLKSRQIKESQNGVLAVATEKGIYSWNARLGIFQLAFSLETLNIENSSVRDLTWGPDSNLWIATNKGIVVLDSHFGFIERIQADAGNANGLLSNVVQRIYFDQDNRMWVGSMGGVAIERENNKPFHHNTLSWLNGTGQQTTTPVWEVFETKSGEHVLVGTMSNGLFLLDANHPGKVMAHFGKQELPFLTIYDILQVDKNNLLIAGDKGLASFNLTNSKAKKISLPLRKLENEAVYHLSEYKSHHYILATKSGIYLYNHREHELLALDDYMQSTLPTDIVITHDYSASGVLWVGTKEGLSLIELPKNYSFKEAPKLKVRNGLLDTLKFGTSVVTSIRANRDETVWVGTTNGVVEFTHDGKILRHLDREAGLASNFINSLEVDESGNLWISTNKGMTVLYGINNQLVNFDYSDGLDNLEFNNEASCISQSGRLYFGGISGVSYFHPDSIQIDFKAPRVSITNMWLFDKKVLPNASYNGEVVIRKPVSDVDTLELNHKNSFLSFRFTSFSFVEPDKAYYAYRMKGLESSWNIVQGKTMASYLNLPPGSYVFQVKAANSDDVWSNVPDEIVITIHPPFWKNSWVMALAAFLIIAMIFLYIRLRSWKLRKRKKELEKEVEERTAEIIEAQEELRQSTDFIEGIVTNAREGITVVSPTGDIRFVNKAACRMLMYSEDELMNKHVNELTPEEYRERDRMMMEIILKQGTASYEKKLKRKDGVAIDVEINASNNVGVKDSVISIFSDITERKSNLRELEGYRNQLESIVEARTKELVIQKEKAERADKLKSAFLANMSHEVRTPLNAIVGFSSLLKRFASTNNEMQEYVAYIEENSASLLQLIQDIIDLSKLESGEFQVLKRQFNLNMLVQQALQKVEAKRHAVGKEVTIRPFTAQTVMNVFSDERRVRQVLEALLDNALKYTDEGSIEVEVSPALDNNHIQVRVKDTGIGIPAHSQKAIFERFVKLESPEKRIFRGTGLGLSIVSHISQMLDLKISVDSTPGEGSVFSFSLPLASNNVEYRDHSIKGRELTPNLTGKSIMIAEDDETNFLLLKEYLYRTKADIIWARNGTEALRKTNLQQPDLIFMDLKMPEKDGLEATRMLRAGGLEVPIIALTAYANELDKEAALGAGCNDYLKKPVSLKAVYEMLRRYFSK